VLDKHASVIMDSSTYGLPVNAPGGYKETNPYATRISTDGIYLHELDSTVWAQGKVDTSHGCLNLNRDNAIWFQNMSLPGDPVQVVNTGGDPLQIWQNVTGRSAGPSGSPQCPASLMLPPHGVNQPPLCIKAWIANRSLSFVRRRASDPVRPALVYRCPRHAESVSVAPAELDGAFEEESASTARQSKGSRGPARAT